MSKRSKSLSAFARLRAAAAGSPASSPVSVPEIRHTNEFEVLAPPTPIPSPLNSRIEEIFTLRGRTTTISPVDDDVVSVKLQAGEAIAVVGICKLSVRSGAIEVHGARIEAGNDSKVFVIFGPAVHALPVITGLAGRTSGEPANEVFLSSYPGGLRDFGLVSDSFNNLWELRTAAIAEEKKESKLSFAIIGYHVKFDRKLNRSVVPFLPNDEWKSAVANLSTSDVSEPGNGQRVLICGPKNTGKSTMTRYVANSILSPLINSAKQGQKGHGIAILDLDPGQPEFGPPGTLSLVHLRSPIFGPSYTHPLQTSLSDRQQDAIIHQHFLGAITPSKSPATYVECVMDLIAKYKELLQSYEDCHLIVNASGWITGDGLKILIGFFPEIDPTVVFHMSDSGPEEAIKSLTAMCKSSNIKLNLIPTQASSSSRQASVLRHMLFESYFHIQSTANANDVLWDLGEAGEKTPLTLKFAGSKQNIDAVVFVDKQFEPNYIADYLHGLTVGIVVLDHLDALQTRDRESDTSASNASLGQSLATRHPERFIFTRTRNEQLPFLMMDPQRSVGINPWMSHCLGVGRVVHLINRHIILDTPVSKEAVIQAAVREHRLVVLVPMHTL